MLPELDRLIDLHKKYCCQHLGTNSIHTEKTIEDLQRDLFCLSDDFCRLELYLQTGMRSKAHYWSEIEDLVL